MKIPTRRTKRLVLGFFAVGLIVVVVFSGSMRFLASQRERQRYEAQRGELKAPEPVSHEVMERELVRTRLFSVKVEPWISAEVPAEISGRVVRTLVEAGQEVAEGDVLVEIDDRRAKIAVELAKARHEESMRLLAEAERLQKSRVVSKTAYESTLAEARVTKAQMDEAQDTLSRHKVLAPFDGVVNERLVYVGDAVNVNQPVAVMVELNRLRVLLDASEGDLAAFPSGKALSLRTTLDGKSFAPVVRFVSRSADPATRLFRVEAELDNSEANLPGGIQGVVEADVQIFARGPVVPASAVRFAGKDALVLKDQDGVPVLTKIVVGPEVDGLFPVYEGLQVGDRITIR